MCRSAVSVEWYHRYADCVGVKLPEEQTCGWMREKNNRSMILEILLRFEIGLKLARTSELRLGFLRRGVTTENLFSCFCKVESHDQQTDTLLDTKTTLHQNMYRNRPHLGYARQAILSNKYRLQFSHPFYYITSFNFLEYQNN